MKTLKLLPNQCKKIGWLIFLPSLIFGLLIIFFDKSFEFGKISFPVFYDSGFFEKSGFFSISKIDWFTNLIGILIIIGGLLVGFSREKNEDEYISSLRLKSVFWSLMVSYSIVLILFLAIFGLEFFNVMIVAMYLPLVLYIFRFNYLLSNEK